MSWLRDLPITWSRHVLDMWPLTWSAHMISTRDLQTLSWYQVIINTNICVMTTSKSLISYTITTSSHYHGTYCPSSKDLVWASSRSALEARKEDYFKINASPGIRWWWLDRGEVPSIATTGAWSRRNALNRFEEDHWGSHEWSGKGRWLAARGLAWPFGTPTSASTMKHRTTRWIGMTAE